MAQLTQSFFETILRLEGGYQRDPVDKGNYNTCGELVGTNMGLSAVAYSTWVGRCVDEAEMRAITRDTAFNFYAWYFNLYNCYKIEDQHLAELIMNNTMGAPGPAAKAEQRALNKLGYKVAIDGSRGPATIAALNKAARANMPRLYNAIRAEWLAYLKRLNSKFYPGWLKRMEAFPPIGTTTTWIVPALLALGFLYLKNRK